MEKGFVEGLLITDVIQERTSKWSIHLTFKLENQKYLLIAKKDVEPLFQPWTISHENVTCCSFCQGKENRTVCPTLVKYLRPLFERVIEEPSIRLEWLFRYESNE